MADNGYNSEALDDLPMPERKTDEPPITSDALTEINIQRNSRTFIVGMTGTGKTYLAERILKTLPRLVVFDTKENLAKRFDLVKGTRKNWSALLRGHDLRIQVKDAAQFTDAAQYFDDMCYRVRKAANCMVYVDEVLDIIGQVGTNPPYNLRALFSKGREPIEDEKTGEIVSGNIGVVACTQRPSRIPVLMMTEADNIFCFRLQNPDDRKTMAGYMGLHGLPPVSDEHGFYYFNKTMTEPVYVREFED